MNVMTLQEAIDVVDAAKVQLQDVLSQLRPNTHEFDHLEQAVASLGQAVDEMEASSEVDDELLAAHNGDERQPPKGSMAKTTGELLYERWAAPALSSGEAVWASLPVVTQGRWNRFADHLGYRVREPLPWAEGERVDTPQPAHNDTSPHSGQLQELERQVESLQALYRDALQAKTQNEVLRSVLKEAFEDYADHQTWRCGHPDRYPWEPDGCPCGVTEWRKRAEEALSDEPCTRRNFDQVLGRLEGEREEVGIHHEGWAVDELSASHGDLEGLYVSPGPTDPEEWAEPLACLESLPGAPGMVCQKVRGHKSPHHYRMVA